MITSPIRTVPKIDYPDSDGQPIADNTQQFRWIVLIKENLELLFANDPNIFVAGDLLWYSVEGHPEICVAPDVLVAFERLKGDRGSYKQWLESNTAQQVVFEILSPRIALRRLPKSSSFMTAMGLKNITSTILKKRFVWTLSPR